MEDIRSFAGECLIGLYENRAVLKHDIEIISKDLSERASIRDSLTHTLQLMHLSSTYLQNIVDMVSTQNIKKIESLLDSALSSIFWDLNLEVKIESTVKRNINVHQIVLYKDGNKGTLKSNGGGIWAVVAIVMKILCNVMLKKYPFIAYDESFSFIADKYIPSTLKFIKGLSENMSLDILGVTHKQAFIYNSPTVYNIDFDPESLSSSEGEPYIKVEKIKQD